MISYSIYVIDDEVVARNGLSMALEKKNFQVKAFESAETALEAIEKKTNGLTNLEKIEKEILSLKICDPACGSGVFLISATNFIAKKIAELRKRKETRKDELISIIDEALKGKGKEE